MNPQEWWDKHATETGRSMLANHDVVTPLEIAKARDIKPQVIYNYLRQGRIGYELNSSNKRVVTKAELFKYLENYLSKEQARQERLERELRGE